MTKDIIPTRTPGQWYTEAELKECEGNKEKSREYFINVAFNARRLAVDYYLDGDQGKAVNMVNYSDSILEHLDAFVQSTADTDGIATALNEAMKAKRDQSKSHRRVP